MEFTGERVIPGMVDSNLMLEHTSRYQFARCFSPGRRVLDLACGTGYGTYMLAQQAEAATGLDLAADAIEYASRHYQMPKLAFEVGDCTAIGHPEASFDLVTAFEIIEHLDQPELLLRESSRVLKSSGVLVLSTPNRVVSQESRSEPNPFHVQEFIASELETLLKRYFKHIHLGIQNHAEGMVIHFPHRRDAHTGNLIVEQPDSNANVGSAQYLIAVCSNLALKTTWPGAFFVASSLANSLLERSRHLAIAQKQYSATRDRLQQVETMIAERDSHLGISLTQGSQMKLRISDLESCLSERDGHLLILQEECAGLRARISELDATLNERNSHLAIAQSEMDGLRHRVSELEAILSERDSHVALALSEIEALQRRLEEVSSTLCTRESHLKIALEENSGRAARITELETESAAQSHHIHLLRQELEHGREQLGQLQRILDRLDASVLFRLMHRLPYFMNYLHRIRHPRLD